MTGLHAERDQVPNKGVSKKALRGSREASIHMLGDQWFQTSKELALINFISKDDGD